MTAEIIVRYVHFIGILLLAGSLFVERFAIKSNMSRKEIASLAKVDAIYGLSALLILGAGLTLWFWVGKPAEWYTKNGLFHMKLTLFAIIGILSIWPTIFFIKKRKGDPLEIIPVPAYISKLISIEILLLFLIPLLGNLVAKGTGL